MTGKAAAATLALACLLLEACSSHTAWQVSAGTPNPNPAGHAHVSGGAGLATLLGLTILGAGAYEATRGGFADSGKSEMAPDRKISEQDCTRPLDYSLGNIRCK